MMSRAHQSGKRRQVQNPPVLAREYLESLGYRITAQTIENQEKHLRIAALERADDQSTPDFCFCGNMELTVGVILPKPFAFYRDQVIP